MKYLKKVQKAADKLKAHNCVRKKFGRAQNGNVAIVTAISLPVVLMISFSALDFGLAVQSDQELKAAAAAAALSAVNEVQIAYESGERNLDLNRLANDTATQIFKARASQVKKTQVTNVSVVPDITNNVFKVDVRYSAEVDSVAMKFLGRDNFRISNNERAQASTLSYINFNFMFDVSGSMGVGASQNDINIIENRLGCAFACHINAAPGSSSYDIARQAGATMRIDVIKDAAIQALDVMEEKSEVDAHMTVGIHTYDNRATELVSATAATNSNFSYLKTRVNQIRMNSTHGGTNTEGSIEKVIRSIPQSGSGRTPDDRIQYLIVLTDGIENSVFYNNGTSNEGTSRHPGFMYYRGNSENPGADVNTPFNNKGGGQYAYAPNASSCDAVKEKGVEIFFINTEYIIPNSGRRDSRFIYIDNNLKDLSVERMKACAGDDDNVFRTDSPEEIINAFKDVIGELATPLRLY